MIVPAPSREEIQTALESLILSASGWRKIFAGDGDEESRVTGLSPANSWLVAAMALAYARSFSGRGTICVAADSRPTGPAMADIIIRVLLEKGFEIRYSGITTIPEVLASVQRENLVIGFAYISASHNPIGHNGLKFGYGDGAVVGGQSSADLITAFRNIVAEEDVDAVAASANNCPESKIEPVYLHTDSWKRKTFDHYLEFTRQLACGDDSELFSRLKKATDIRPIGVVSELNGSARSTTVDKPLLKSIGVAVHSLNDTPGNIVHRIVPEGASLDLCRETLEQKHRSDSAYELGYVPDNDGDRGNLVYVSRDGTARILEAQQVFALACLGELAYLAYSRKNDDLDDTTVVSNGPTSMRIDRIAGVFGAAVQRAEVGEANVVNLARKLRESGRTVRFLGEGSNGGNITHPSTCRDPLNTLLTIIKLLLIRGDADNPGPFERWCAKSGQSDKYRLDFDLNDILGTLPSFTTTSAYEDRAIMKIRSKVHGRLKEEYERLFAEEWPSQRRFIEENVGAVDWRVVNYEGIETRNGVGNRNPDGQQKGGLKVLLIDSHEQTVGYLWMRGSGTEPVFRVLVDLSGDLPEVEEHLLKWHRGLIQKADAAATPS